MADHDMGEHATGAHSAEVTPLARESRGTVMTHDEVPGLSVWVRRDGDAGVVRLSGELDAYTSPRLDELCRELHDSGLRHVALDLTLTTFMDSSGLRALLSCHRRLVDAGGTMELGDVSEPVLRLLVITGLADHFGIPEVGPGARAIGASPTEGDP